LYMGIGEVIAAWGRQQKEKQEQLGFVLWDGCTVFHTNGEHAYTVRLKVPMVEGAGPRESVQQVMANARTFVDGQKDGYPRVLLYCKTDVPFYGLNTVRIVAKNSIYQETAHSYTAAPTDDEQYAEAGIIMWGSNGLSVWRMDILVPATDAEQFSRDMTHILTNPSDAQGLQMTIPLPGTSEVMQFSCAISR
jgi:hypothetical protein